MISDEPVKYHGVLVRSGVTPQRITMRFCESFQPDLEAVAPVMVITFEGPAFSSTDIPEFMADDVALAIGQHHVDIAELYGDRTTVLAAQQVMAAREAYDAEDLREFLRRAADREERDWRVLKSSREVVNTGINLIIELLRRAEIKAATSDALEEKQSAAIAVLNRLLVHFRAKD